MSSRRPRPSLRVANSCAQERSAHTSASACLPSAPICSRPGKRRPRRRATRRSCCARCSRRSSSSVHKDERRAHLTLRWRGGALTESDIDLPRPRPAIVRTDEDTIALVRRLAAHYPDAVIAGILNRQDRKSAYGHRFTANLVGNLRRHWNIPCFERPDQPARGRTADHQTNGSCARRCNLDDSSLAQRWHHRRRAAHSRCAVAHSPYRRLARPCRRRSSRRLPHHVPNHAPAGRFPANRVAACQARRDRSRPCHGAGAKKGLRLKLIRSHPDLFAQPS